MDLGLIGKEQERRFKLEKNMLNQEIYWPGERVKLGSNLEIRLINTFKL